MFGSARHFALRGAMVQLGIWLLCSGVAIKAQGPNGESVLPAGNPTAPAQERTISKEVNVELLLNHIYVVLDAASFDATKSSEFFNGTFAKTDSGLPSFDDVEDSDGSIYVRGKHTYLELLGPENAFGEPPGKVGVGFSVETQGAISLVEKRLRSAGLAVSRSSRMWDFETSKPVNWFENVFPHQAEGSDFVWWVSEYHADFLPALYPDSPPEKTGIKRQHFLAPHYAEGRLLRDIAELNFRLTDEQKENLVSALRILGFEHESQAQADLLTSEDLSIGIQTKQGREPTLKSIGFSTNPVNTLRRSDKVVGNLLIRWDTTGKGELLISSDGR